MRLPFGHGTAETHRRGNSARIRTYTAAVMPKRLPRARTLKGDPKLAYYDSGGGVAGEPPVLLLHGSTMRSEDWDNIFPRLATRYRVVAYDARGHGRSGHATSYELEGFVDDARRAIGEVLEKPPIVVGHSLGGVVGAVLAADSPDLVRGLVLEDPPLAGFGTAGSRDFFRALRKALDSVADAAAFKTAVTRLPLTDPGLRGERTVGEVRGFYAPERMATYYAAVDPAFAEHMTRPDDAGRETVASALAKLRVPVLLLAADPRYGTALQEGEADRVVAALPDAQLVRFPGVGHRIHGVRPEPFLEAIEPFLRRIRTGAPAQAF